MSVINTNRVFAPDVAENLAQNLTGLKPDEYEHGRIAFGAKVIGLVVAHRALFGFDPAENGAPAKVQIDLAPVDGSFDYPGGSHDPGELPLDPIGSITVYPKSEPGQVLLQISDLSLAAQDIPATGLSFLRLVLSGADTIRLSDARDRVSGLGGDDTIFGRAGNDLLSGNAGDDRIVSSSLEGEHAKLDGGAGKDAVSGGAGDDVVKGGKGADVLGGGGGQDRVIGGAGNDILRGGEGADVLTGGKGTDTFVFGSTRLFPPTWDSGVGVDADTITDFARGHDRLDLSLLFGDGVDAAFRGARDFTGTGQLRAVPDGADILVQVNLADDEAPELEIRLSDLATLTRGDLIL